MQQNYECSLMCWRRGVLITQENDTNETNQTRVTILLNGHCLGFENLSISQRHFRFFIRMNI